MASRRWSACWWCCWRPGSRWFAWARTGGGGPADAIRVTALFPNAAGVNVGTDVRVAGLKVGTVAAQRLDPQSFQVEVTLALDPKVKIPKDSSAAITSEGLLGGTFIALVPGGDPTPLKTGDTIVDTQGSIDMMGMIGQFINKSRQRRAGRRRRRRARRRRRNEAARWRRPRWRRCSASAAGRRRWRCRPRPRTTAPGAEAGRARRAAPADARRAPRRDRRASRRRCATRRRWRERVATLGLLNKRNGIARDITLRPGQSVRVGDVIVRLRACETTAPWEHGAADRRLRAGRRARPRRQVAADLLGLALQGIAVAQRRREPALRRLAQELRDAPSRYRAGHRVGRRAGAAARQAIEREEIGR